MRSRSNDRVSQNAQVITNSDRVGTVETQPDPPIARDEVDGHPVLTPDRQRIQHGDAERTLVRLSDTGSTVQKLLTVREKSAVDTQVVKAPQRNRQWPRSLVSRSNFNSILEEKEPGEAADLRRPTGSVHDHKPAKHEPRCLYRISRLRVICLGGWISTNQLRERNESSRV